MLNRLFGGAPEPDRDDGATWESSHVGMRYRVHRTGQSLRLAIGEGFPQLTATPGAIHGASGFVSAAMLAHKAKQIDDGIYAAVEIANQHGVGVHRGKTFLLERVLERLAGEDGEAKATLEAAAVLGGVRSDAGSRARALTEEFLADALRSKPLGFYTWSDDLARIFRQDRMLQSNLANAGDLRAVVAALTDDAEARAVYERTMHVNERLTNPLAWTDLRALVRGDGRETPSPISFAPPSRAHETELLKRMFGNSPIPDGFDLARELALRIRDGRIDLTPAPNAGFYDVQTWALETLAAPARAPLEAVRLVLDPSYEKHLEELFRAVIASTRETHVKQLEVAVGGAAPPREVPLLVGPRLTIEPLPTFYARRADAYRFVRALLAETFGEGALAAMRGRRAHGYAVDGLDVELTHAVRLFEGAAARASIELGATAAGEPALFDAWASRLDDPDLAADARMMVPVFFDLGRQKTKVWMIVGWAAEPLQVSFVNEPRVEVLAGKPSEVRMVPRSYAMATPIMMEAYVSRLLDRDEFRALCNECRSPADVVAALA